VGRWTDAASVMKCLYLVGFQTQFLRGIDDKAVFSVVFPFPIYKVSCFCWRSYSLLSFDVSLLCPFVHSLSRTFLRLSKLTLLSCLSSSLYDEVLYCCRFCGFRFHCRCC
jgi:hypothetical protein